MLNHQAKIEADSLRVDVSFLPRHRIRSSCASRASIAIRVGCRRPDEASIFIMTEPKGAPSAETLFADFAATPAEHFRLHFFGAVLVCIEYAAACTESFEAAMERFPFLVGYNNELAQRLAGLSSHEAFARWCAALEAWESRAPGHLPLRALRELLGLDATAAMCLITVGLGEEDPRFGALFETLQATPGERHPTCGLLRQCVARTPGAFGLFLAAAARTRSRIAARCEWRRDAT